MSILQQHAHCPSKRKRKKKEGEKVTLRKDWIRLTKQTLGKDWIRLSKQTVFCSLFFSFFFSNRLECDQSDVYDTCYLFTVRCSLNCCSVPLVMEKCALDLFHRFLVFVFCFTSGFLVGGFCFRSCV